MFVLTKRGNLQDFLKRASMSRFCAILILNLLYFGPIFGTAEYLYPVGYDPKQQQFYILYQSQLNQLKLWSWDPETKIAFPATLSSFNPAGFQFLPDYTGFSFIDHGLIRVKSYNGRLVKTIELLAPLINLNSICWQDLENFYFCAQSQDTYGIFHASLSRKIPQITPILWEPGVDYFYPQIFDSHLFCIKKDRDLSSIIVILNNLIELGSGAVVARDTKANQTTQTPNPIELFTTPSNPGLNLKFLQVVNSTQAYFLTQVPACNSQVVSFDCYSLQFTLPETAITTIANNTSANSSKVKRLFSFDLPKAYFKLPEATMGENSNVNTGAATATTNLDLRVHESILPFLPKYTANKIYFCAHQPNSQKVYSQISEFETTPKIAESIQPDLNLQVNIYSYDLASAQIIQLTQAKANQLCCGLLVLPNGQLCYGGSALDLTKIHLTKSELYQQLTQTTVPFDLDDQWGLPKIDLPLLK